MDVFLIQGGVVQNIVSVESIEKAQPLYPEYVLVERVEENMHVQIGETL